MGRIEQVCDALGFAIATAVNNAGITTPAQAYKGYPLITELKEVMDLGQYALAINHMQKILLMAISIIVAYRLWKVKIAEIRSQ